MNEKTKKEKLKIWKIRIQTYWTRTEQYEKKRNIATASIKFAHLQSIQNNTKDLKFGKQIFTQNRMREE